MLQTLKKLARDTKANVLLVTAIGTSSLVGAAGIGVDTVQWYLWKRQLQQAVDSGAMAGALSIYQSADVAANATNEIGRNFADTFTVVRIVNPPQIGDFAGDTGAVEAVVTTQRSLPFSSLFLDQAPIIEARSVAATIGGGDHCVISLADDGTGITAQGNASVNLGCGAAANSRSSDAITLGGSSYLTSNPISSVGGISYGSNNIPSDTSLFPYGIPVTDPLASRNLTAPISPTGCTANNLNIRPNQTVTLNPGRYCNGMALKGRVTMNPGVYIIDRGTFSVNSQARVTGDGVTIILTGTTSSNVATMSINGGAELDLSAPTPAQDATWHGILFYQDQIGSDQETTINGGSDLIFNGIVYFPNGDVRFNGNAGQHADCLLLVAQRVNFSGTSSLDNNCDSHIDSVDTSSRIIRVVE